MSYTPAKVTIDPQEYNELLKHKETVENNDMESMKYAKEDIKPYQKAISAIFEAVSNSSGIPHEVAIRILEAPIIKGVKMIINRQQKRGEFNVNCEMYPPTS